MEFGGGLDLATLMGVEARSQFGQRKSKNYYIRCLMLLTKEQSLVSELGIIHNEILGLFGDEVSKTGDAMEVTHHIHALQNMLLAQCAARFYPHKYRLMGKLVGKI